MQLKLVRSALKIVRSGVLVFRSREYVFFLKDFPRVLVSGIATKILFFYFCYMHNYSGNFFVFDDGVKISSGNLNLTS